jgi:hypothetical protein
MSDRDLARYQDALLSLFWREDADDTERMARLSSDPAFAPYAAHVATFDRDLVALGAGITQRWGRPRVRRAKSR